MSSYINHLPAFTQDQTYALAAFYPYATRPDGEWAYQAQLGYKFKRKFYWRSLWYECKSEFLSRACHRQTYKSYRFY